MSGEGSFKKICIIGVGLIGGSLGMALKYRRAADHIAGYDVDYRVLKKAEELEAVDRGYSDLAEAVGGADLIILSTPLSVFEDIAQRMLPFVKEDAVITDTGSTKACVVRKLERVFSNKGYFVGGHPMSGSEKGGIESADRYLFENAVYVITPTENSSRQAVEKVALLAGLIGSRPVFLSPEEHDAVVAAVSHVPHIAAAGLVLTLGELEKRHPCAPVLAAGGFRDTTRIAASDPELWEQICFSNRIKVIEVLENYIDTLSRIKIYLEENNRNKFKKALAQAKEQRLRIPSKMKGILPSLFEIVVVVPDRPGVIGFLGTLLGSKGINIIDIEILRVREGEGGTIRLGFQSEEAMEKAVEALKAENILVRKL
ncbi:MAG TPA: prephenate dehydrogenase/arogenate dehydrogenase family protein [Peptococcaceae bacterium]|nr:MAG: Prephenate dehydrogenase [Clostridia bacterium 41_269]HBT20513.1 prephenate dehydrogenase/arogenate dehydrogenase family protein [Peptococcaceae bacterium]